MLLSLPWQRWALLVGGNAALAMLAFFAATPGQAMSLVAIAAVSVLLLVPLAYPPDGQAPAASTGSWLEQAACFGLLALASTLAFSGAWQPVTGPLPLAFLPVPFMIWGAMRFGPWGALSAVVLEAIAVVAGTSFGVGPFGPWSPPIQALLLQSHLSLVGTSVMTVALLFAERERTRAVLAAQHRSLEEAHARLLELDSLKTQFLSAISHEMKTPLTVIVGNAELLEDRYPQEPNVQGIVEGALRLSGQLNRILDYCALVSGTLPLYKRDINLHELISNVRGMLEIGEDGRRYQLETEILGDLPPVEGDSRRLTQILVELVDNARKHTPPGGTIGIRAVGVPHSVRLEVWNTGAGFSAAEKARLTSELNHHGPPEEQDSGLGLGLTIVKKLAELHGGSLELESTPGSGARFSVVLPLAG